MPLIESCIEIFTANSGPAHRNTQKALAVAVALYESWDKAEPGKGYDAKAATLKAKLGDSGSK